MTYVDVSGRGTVYTFTIMRRGDGPFRDKAPYVLAYVRLDEGPVMMTNIVGTDPESVSVGQAVQVVFEPAGDADAIPRFTPVLSASRSGERTRTPIRGTKNRCPTVERPRMVDARG